MLRTLQMPLVHFRYRSKLHDQQIQVHLFCINSESVAHCLSEFRVAVKLCRFTIQQTRYNVNVRDEFPVHEGSNLT